MAAGSHTPLPRITTLRNGRLEPLIARPPLYSSEASSRWHGLILEVHRADAEYVRPDLKSRSNLIHVFTGPVRHEWHVDGHMHRVNSGSGSVLIVPDGLEASVQVWRARPDMQWILELDPTRMEQGISEALGGSGLELVPHFEVTDSQLLRLLQTLHGDLCGGSPAGSLFGEAIGAALALHLAQHYSTRSGATRQLTGGVAEASLRRVLEYIQANLAGDLHLQELAEVADLSTFHFAKLFKRSTGCSPHQFVLQRRLERAKDLLRNPRISLSEVSLRAGFADQSHLSNVFRRFVGLTPARFRALG
jgi:AraC family transcriptional regulator